VNSRSTGLLIGSVVGALLGLLVAWIIFEDDEGTEVGPGGAARWKVGPSEAINLTVGTIAVVRQIAAMRRR